LQLQELKKHQLKQLQKAVSRELRERYAKHKGPKYGNLQKGFRTDEFTLFLQNVKNPKAQLAYQLQAYLGLRVGEVVQIRLGDIDWEHRRLFLITEKSQTHDSLYLHDKAYNLLQAWVSQYHKEIVSNDGYLLFAEARTRSRNPRLHISPNWLRNYLRQNIRRSGLEMTYAQSIERNGRTPRTLHRLTTHSLRHFFGT
jgi:integrase